MLRTPTWSARVQNAGLAVAVLAAGVLTVAAYQHRGDPEVPAGPVPVASAGVLPGPTASAPPGTATASATPTTTTTPRGAASGVPADVRALLLGDGLMVGVPTSAPTTLSELTAADLGWTTTVDARPGSGFTTPGDGSYVARVTAAVAGPTRYDVVVVEGGANDVDLDPDPVTLAGRVDEVVAAIRAAQPQASVVLVGVYSPLGAPVSDGSRAVDDVLAERARALDVPLLSPIADGWLVGQPASFTSADGYTPSPAGSQYLAERLSGALRALGLGPVRP